VLKVAYESTPRTPVTVALVDDYDIMVMASPRSSSSTKERVVITELDTNMAVSEVLLAAIDRTSRMASKPARVRLPNPFLSAVAGMSPRS
jgi:hypothetical protein